MRDSGLTKHNSGDSTVPVVDTIALSPGEVEVKAFSDGSVYLGLVGTDQQLGRNFREAIDGLAHYLSEVSVAAPGKLYIDLSNIHSVPDSLKMALTGQITKNIKGSGAAEVLLIEPTAAVTTWLEQSNLSRLASFVVNRTVAMETLKLDQERSREISVALGDSAEVGSKNSISGSFSNILRPERNSEPIATVHAVSTALTEPVLLLNLSPGIFAGTANGQPLSELLRMAVDDPVPVVLDLTATNFLAENGPVELIKIIKSVAAAGKTTHIAVSEGSQPAQKIKDYRLERLSGIKIHSSPDQALADYTDL